MSNALTSSKRCRIGQQPAWKIQFGLHYNKLIAITYQRLFLLYSLFDPCVSPDPDQTVVVAGKVCYFFFSNSNGLIFIAAVKTRTWSTVVADILQEPRPMMAVCETVHGGFPPACLPLSFCVCECMSVCVCALRRFSWLVSRVVQSLC